MNNLLLQKFRSVKNEITALKTAHKRGLGMLRIYKKIYLWSSLGVQDQHFSRAILTINFDNSFPAYPIVNIVGEVISSVTFGKSIEVEEFVYTNGGYSASVIIAAYRNDSLGLTQFQIFSTAPLLNINYEEQ